MTQRIQVDDEMVQRAQVAINGELNGVVVRERLCRKALEAALNPERRKGEKDRRKECDDRKNYYRRSGRSGRRNGDTSFMDLPRKSDRLKREALIKSLQNPSAPERAPTNSPDEIHVSEGMIEAGLGEWSEAFNDLSDSGFIRRVGKRVCGKVYRAMRRVAILEGTP